MSSITCPRCGSPVPLHHFFDVTNKPFCARCGWNLDHAEAALAGKSTIIKFIPIGIAAFGLFAFLTASRGDMPFLFIAPALFMLIALAPVWSYYSTRKAIAAAKLTMNPDLALAQPPPDPSLQILQSLPRPRRVRYRFTGSFAVAAIALVFLTAGVFVFLLVLNRVNRPRPSPIQNDFTIVFPFLFMIVFFVVLVAVPIFREKRNRPLLRDGEIAFARVTAQQTIRQGKASYSKIDYEFQTSSNQIFHNSVRDLTNAVFEGMTIPVFYDAADPSKNTPLCATYLTIASSPY